MLYSLLSISIFFIAIFPFSPTAQQVTSIKSPTVVYPYSFTFRNDTILIGGNSTVVVVEASDLTLRAGESKNVPRFSQLINCGITDQPSCTANVIDHVFPFNDSFLACGSNGGEGGCSLLEDATDTPISETKIHLSGNVRPNNSPLKTAYVKNSIYFNPANDVIYSLYLNILDLFHFVDFAPGSTPNAISDIPSIITSSGPGNSPQVLNYFYNTPTPGNIFKYSYDSTTAFEYIHIPFTEIALEKPVSMDLDYTFLLGSYHGRLARICAIDLGQFTLPATFGTFNKITIDCRQALGIRYPTNTYYVSVALKELFIIDSNNIYGFFTSQNTAEKYVQSSAVCKFISNRNDVTMEFNLETGFRDVYFNGYDPTSVAEIMGWSCSNPLGRIVGTTREDLYTASVVNVLHMKVVYNQAILAFDKHFESVVRDTTCVVTSGGSEEIVLFYATTYDGFIIKMKVDTDISLLGEFSVTDSELFNAEIREIGGVKYLFAISNEQLLKISLELCSHYDSAVACQRDPQCEWSTSPRSCNQYDKVSERVELTVGVVDDTCRLSLLTSTNNALTFSLVCDTTLPPVSPSISAVTLDNTVVSMISYNNDSSTNAVISVSRLAAVTPYILTVELNYLYGFVPDLTIIAYTESILEGIDVTLPFVCPTAVDDTSITLESAATFPDYLQVCVTCDSNQFYTVVTSSSVVAFDFPWSDCEVTTESFTSAGVKANSSSCPTFLYNRCSQSSSFTHLNFSFESTSTTITARLYDGIPMEQYGITGYVFTVNGVQRTLTDSNTIVFSSLTPSTQYTVEYNASTECGDMFDTSTTVTTLADWSRVEDCAFSSDGQVFNYTITDRTLCLDTLSNCMDNMTSNCDLTLAQVNGNTLTYDVTLSTSICTVSVFPVGRYDLVSYYGCIERFSLPITYQISIHSHTTTTDSVSFNFTIMSSSQYFKGMVRLLDAASSVVQVYSLLYQSVGNFETGFYDLDQNTTYTIEISVDNVKRELEFTTDRSLLSLPCSPLGDYNVVFTGDTFQLKIERNVNCPAGLAATYICLFSFDNDTIETDLSARFTILSHTFMGLDPMKSYAFALVNETVCPPLTSSAYRFIYSDSIYQTTTSTMSTTNAATVATTTNAPTATTTTNTGIPLALVTSSVSLFYTAVGTSSISVVISAGGLSVMFGLIIIYPKLLKKSGGSNTKPPLDTDTYEMSGMNNPIDDTAS